MRIKSFGNPARRLSYTVTEVLLNAMRIGRDGYFNPASRAIRAFSAERSNRSGLEFISKSTDSGLFDDTL